MASESVKSEITGKVWKVICAAGANVGEDDAIMVIESMKMEIPVLSPCTGRVVTLMVNEGDDVSEGQEVAIVES